MTIADLKALIEGETTISSSIQYLFPPDSLSRPPEERHPLENGQTIEQAGLKAEDVVVMVVQDPTQNADPRGQHSQSSQARNQRQDTRRGPDIEQLRLQALGNSAISERLRQTDPGLADAVHDRQAFHTAMEAFQRRQAQAEAEKQAQLDELNANPFDLAAQKKIEESIRQERVNNNIQKALEEHPEGSCLFS